LEYSLLGLNPWGKSFCSHDCDYCYCPDMFRMSRDQWRAQPFVPRKDLIRQLRLDCAELRGTDERVLCCFAGDLYNPEAAKSGISRQILETFREFDVPWQVLTKGGLRAVADFDLYGPNDAFATTLTFLSATYSLKHEPGAALPMDRRHAIFQARERKIQTWVSLEPVLSPQSALAIIEETHDYVDLYKIGRLNHDPAQEEQIDDQYGWAKFAWNAMNLCNKYDKPFIIKDDLRAYCDFPIVGAATFDPRKVVRA
jgi:hypothetical protein